jgi:ribose transport system ATP-binding protein
VAPNAMSPRSGSRAAVTLVDVSKRFPGVAAVSHVDLEVFPGEVHVFAGENGAGKSTLMKLLAQVESPTSGRIEIGGVPVVHHGPGAARRLGISMVHQEFALAADLSVAENLFIGAEPGGYGWISRSVERRNARHLLRRVGLEVNPERKVGRLSTAQQQRVELAKALAVDARVLILDEPTASLTERETRELFGIVRDLTARGIAVLYISHRLDEIFEIADRVTVMRDGAVVATKPVSELDEAQLVRLMVGHEVENLYPRHDHEIGDVRLRVSGLNRGDAVRDVSLTVRSG